jgi:hypothetical protein
MTITRITHPTHGDYYVAPQPTPRPGEAVFTYAELRQLYAATGGDKLDADYVGRLIQAKRVLGATVESARKL